MYVYGTAARVRSDENIVQVSVVAKLNSVLAAVCNADRLLADIQISGLLCVCRCISHYVSDIVYICNSTLKGYSL